MNSKYRTIIVDDEILARNDLSAILASFENIDIVGTATPSWE